MKRKIFIILLILILLCLYKANNENIIIPSNSIRLRVIPNSNDPKDINMKEKVKAYLEKDIYNLTNNITDIEEARYILKNSTKTIEENISNIFNDNNYSETFTVNYGLNYFPEKIYKGNTYESGYYESLVVAIGASEGDNFWCVLFPNFCLVDINENHTYKLYFKELINKIF